MRQDLLALLPSAGVIWDEEIWIEDVLPEPAYYSWDIEMTGGGDGDPYSPYIEMANGSGMIRASVAPVAFLNRLSPLESQGAHDEESALGNVITQTDGTDGYESS